MLVQLRWAMREPLIDERATGMALTLFFLPDSIESDESQKPIAMKKLLLVMAIILGGFVCNAQSLGEDLSNLEKICAKLQKSLAKIPNETGVAEIDDYTKGCVNSGLGATANAIQLQDFYKREIGETVDGVTDVTITKPTLDEWVALSETIALQIDGNVKISQAADKATKAVKDAPKIKAIGYGKTVNWSTDLLQVSSQALAEEAKAVKSIIETLKSGNNL